MLHLYFFHHLQHCVCVCGGGGERNKQKKKGKEEQREKRKTVLLASVLTIMLRLESVQLHSSQHVKQIETVHEHSWFVYLFGFHNTAF